MREAMESVLYDNGVDVVLNGHLHEYERTNPVYVSSFGPHPARELLQESDFRDLHVAV